MKLSNFRKSDITFLFTYVIGYIERKQYKSSDKIGLDKNCYFFFHDSPEYFWRKLQTNQLGLNPLIKVNLFKIGFSINLISKLFV